MMAPWSMRKNVMTPTYTVFRGKLNVGIVKQDFAECEVVALAIEDLTECQTEVRRLEDALDKAIILASGHMVCGEMTRTESMADLLRHLHSTRRGGD